MDSQDNKKPTQLYDIKFGEVEFSKLILTQRIAFKTSWPKDVLQYGDLYEFVSVQPTMVGMFSLWRSKWPLWQDSQALLYIEQV